MSLLTTLIEPATKLLDKVIEDKDQKAKLAHELATMADHFIVQPVIIFIIALTGINIPDLPSFNMNTLLTVLGGLLGIGGLRTYEKQKGLTK